MSNNWLFKKLVMPELNIVQAELLSALDYDYTLKGTHAKTYSEQYLRNAAPTLFTWLDKNILVNYSVLRFYVTSPLGELSYHIDGNESSNMLVPYSLNIPVINCSDTTMEWFNCPENNLREWKSPNTNYSHIILPRNKNKLTPLYPHLELSTPALVQTNIVHRVVNHNPAYRIILSVKWLYSSTNEIISENNLLEASAYE